MLLQITDSMVSGLGMDPAEFARASAIAQVQAEGKSGANRKLEKAPRVSSLRLSGGVCYLPHWPVDAAQPITVSLKSIAQATLRNSYELSGVSFGNTFSRNPYGLDSDARYSTQSPEKYVDLTSEQFEYDADLNRLTVYASRSAHHPMAQTENLMVKIGYTAGYDFNVDSADANVDPNVLAMKAAILQMVTANSAQVEGITEFTLDDFYKVKINANNVSSTASTALSVFQQYKNCRP